MADLLVVYIWRFGGLWLGSHPSSSNRPSASFAESHVGVSVLKGTMGTYFVELKRRKQEDNLQLLRGLRKRDTPVSHIDPRNFRLNGEFRPRNVKGGTFFLEFHDSTSQMNSWDRLESGAWGFCQLRGLPGHHFPELGGSNPTVDQGAWVLGWAERARESPKTWRKGEDKGVLDMFGLWRGWGGWREGTVFFVVCVYFFRLGSKGEPENDLEAFLPTPMLRQKCLRVTLMGTQ